MEGLDHYFNFEGTSVGKSWFEIKGSLEGSNALSAVRKAFWAEFDDSAEVAITPTIKMNADLYVPHSSTEPLSIFSLSPKILSIYRGQCNSS